MCEAPACLVGAKASENGGEAANFCEYCKNAFLRREFHDLETLGKSEILLWFSSNMADIISLSCIAFEFVLW